MELECTVDSSKSEGAFLYVEPRAPKTKIDERQYQRFTQYIKKNRKALLVAQEGLGPSLVLVSGYAKTAAWAVGAYQLEQNAHGATLVAGLSVAHGGGGWKIEGSSGLLMQENHGPVDGNSTVSWEMAREPQAPHDQCVFLYYYKIASRPWWKIWLKAQAGPAPLPDPDRGTEQPPAILSESPALEVTSFLVC